MVKHNVIQKWLPAWPGISVEVTVPQLPKPDVLYIDVSLTAQAIINYNAGVKNGQISKDIIPYAYFKIRNEEDVITNFPDPLIIHIRYSQAAWETVSRKSKREYPRVYHLQRNGDEWVNNWIEFDILPDDIEPPNSTDPYGHVYIKVNNLPDPNIGGPGD